MPITPSHTWHQSESWLSIHVALRSVSPPSIDILTTECFVKVNCSPYLFQVDLFGDIDVSKSSAVVDNGTVRFFLTKLGLGSISRSEIEGSGLGTMVHADQQSKGSCRVVQITDLLLPRCRGGPTLRGKGSEFETWCVILVNKHISRGIQKQERLWDRLSAVGERKDILLRREASLESERQRTLKVKEDLKIKNAQLGRHAVQSQMKLDEGKRKLVEQRKASELKAERDRIEVWQKDIRTQLCTKSELPMERLSDMAEKDDSSLGNGTTTVSNLSTHKKEDLPGESAHEISSDMEQRVERKLRSSESISGFDSSVCWSKAKQMADSPCIMGLPSNTLPAPRKHVSVAVKFTSKKLAVNLPARESRDKVQLKESIMSEPDTIDISEREPLFLQDKADNFYEKGNFRSAVNAYSDAIRKNPTLFLSFANRAASYLELKQFEHCLADCSRALQLLEGMHKELCFSDLEGTAPDDESCSYSGIEALIQESRKLLHKQDSSINRAASTWYRLAEKKILAIRGIALCNTKEFGKARADFEKALSRTLSAIEMEEISREVQEIYRTA